MLLGGNASSKCEHAYVPLPGHRSSENYDICESLLGNDEVSIAQELRGISMASQSYVLRGLLKSFQEQHKRDGPYVFKKNVEVIHSFIDPSGGGNGSEFAVVSMVREDSAYVIAGMSSWYNNCSENSMVGVTRMLNQHYDGLFRMPVYSNAKVYLYFESNMSNISATYWTDYIEKRWPSKFHFVRAVKRDVNQIGVVTDEKSKEEWTLALQEVMSCCSLFYAKEFVTSQVDGKDLKESQKLVCAKFEDQCNRYCRDVKIPVDPFGKLKVSYGAKNGGMLDDLVTCCAAVVLQIKKRLTDVRYAQWRAANQISHG